MSEHHDHPAHWPCDHPACASVEGARQEPYRVEVDNGGCERCSHGMTWTVVGPDGVAAGTSWEDEDVAGYQAGILNDAYRVGHSAALLRAPEPPAVRPQDNLERCTTHPDSSHELHCMVCEQAACEESDPLLAAASLAPPEGLREWQPITTNQSLKGEYVLVAMITDGQVRRVSEAAHNGLGWYDKGGKSCHWRTHWAPIPPLARVDPPTGEP